MFNFGAMIRGRLVIVVAFLVLAGISGTVQSQITYTATFTRLLDKARIDYAVPAEQWLHVTLPPDHDYMHYDLVLENDRGDFEVRYRFHTGLPAEDMPPAVEVARLVAHIASNNPETEIRIQIPPDRLLQEVFNAEAGVVAHFTPKEDFSMKPYGTLLSLYPSGYAGIDIVILYTDPEYNAVEKYRSVRFRD